MIFNITTEPPTHVGKMYVLMSSMTYLIICIAIIFILFVILLVILFLWCWYISPKVSFSRKTIRYSSLQSDEEEDGGNTRNKSGRNRLMFSDVFRLPQHRSAGQIAKEKPHPRHWTSVPVNPNIDMNAGHLLLAYIEDNLRDKGRLDKEWEQLVSYHPDQVHSLVGVSLGNKHKNRYPDLLPYDHNRVVLNSELNSSGSDYINASFIVDVDPRHPKYIATQGPMTHTVADFWQMVWEQGVSIIVMLTPLSDMGLTQSCQYWPSNGVETYHKFEVRLVSEHRHTEDYIVRSFYVLNTQKKTSRTVTQFHFLSWSVGRPPVSPTPLLEFWRKVNSAYTQPHSPLVVQCSEGVGRTGTYILIDMTLTRLTSSGAKEINLAATVEHLRDQRQQMVKTKPQFEFALDALVEETQRMLNAAQTRTTF